jgi:hypothetical protein
MTDKRCRLIGLFILIVSLGMFYIAVVEPIAQARAGEESIRYSRKVVFLLPLAAIMAIGFLAKGKSFFDAVSNENGTRFTRLGYCIVVAGTLAGIAAVYVYGDVFDSLGYTRRRAW